VAAIKRATVPIINFPASGFACNQFQTNKRSSFNDHNNTAPIHQKKQWPLTSENTRKNPTFAACNVHALS